ncbi:MAG TPA: hypothetical protein VK772_16065 [Puia sp.]|nr:hypothetical protein [Puia sp.]
MADILQERKERIKIIKTLLARWILKQGTAEKAALLLSKNPHIKLPKSKSR